MHDNADFEHAPPEWGASVSPEPRNRFLQFLGEMLQTLLVAALLFLGVNLLTARIRVEGISMEPNLHEGQFVVVNRLAYRWGEANRGDIIVFRFPLNPKRRFIKRVIGLPGDTVVVRSGQVIINGEVIYEPYLTVTPRYNGEWIPAGGGLAPMVLSGWTTHEDVTPYDGTMTRGDEERFACECWEDDVNGLVSDNVP